MELSATEARYAQGTNNYPTAWSGRATLSYDYFYNTF